jgi:hypothetical protein
MGRLSVIAIGLSLFSGAVHAQQATPSQDHKPVFLPSVQYGSPLRTSGGLGVFLPTKDEGGFRRRGFIVGGDVGQGGAKASFGAASIVEYLEADARGVIYRTWASPRQATGHATYAGAEAGIMIAYVRVSAGVAHRVGGAEGPHATIFSWNAGLQFPF